MTAPTPVFTHLLRMTNHRGTFEHACLTEPRLEHGYCTDDMARVLVVTTRDPDPLGAVKGLAGKALQFLNDALSYNGSCRNRMDHAGNWTDQPTTDDHWGRCMWGLGTAAAHSGVSLVRRLAVIQFERAAKARSSWPRAMAFAAVGAAELLSVEPGNAAALRLLADYAATVAGPTSTPDWPWPEPRLAYANAILPEAMIAAGVALDDPDLKQRGLDLLQWLRPGSAGQPARVRPAADRGSRPCGRLCTCRSRRPAGALAGRAPVVRRLVRGCQRLWVAHVGQGDRRRFRRVAG